MSYALLVSPWRQSRRRPRIFLPLPSSCYCAGTAGVPSADAMVAGLMATDLVQLSVL